jgi:hypothetical protein
MIRHGWRALASLALVATAALLPASPASAVADGFTVTARAGSLQAGGTTVTLAGRYTCGPFAGGVPDRGVVDLTLTQTVDGMVTTAFGFLTPTVCDGRPQRYAVNLTAVNGTFQPGRALWSASGYVEGSTGLQSVSVPPTPIRIR